MLFSLLPAGIPYAKTGEDEAVRKISRLDTLAETSFDEGDMDRSIMLWKAAVREAASCSVAEEDPLAYSGLLQSIGICYRRKSMMDSALHYYNEAWEIIKDMDSQEAVSEKTRLLTSTAILYSFMGRDEESVLYAGKALEAARLGNDPDMAIYAATNAGGIYARNGDFSKSGAALRTALSVAEESGHADKLLSVMTIMASMYNIAGERDSVERYLALADGMAEGLPENSVEVLGFRETQAAVLSGMGRYAESNGIYRRLLSASGSNSSVKEDAGYMAMARNYAALGRLDSVVSCYEKAYSVLDSRYGEQITAQLSEWSAKYGAAENELEIARLTEESLRTKAIVQMWIIIALALTAALMVAVSTIAFIRHRRKKEEELRLARTYIEGLENERVRVAEELHDGVCNSLIGIGMQLSAMDGGSRKDAVLSMIGDLHDEVRRISHDMMPPQFDFSDIEEILKTYTERLGLNESVRTGFTSSIEGNANWKDVPGDISHEVYRIFQEHTGNIVKHSGAGKIDVAMSLCGGTLVLTVEDDGKPPVRERGAKKGIGLSVMADRARSIGASVSFTTAAGGNVFRLEVDFQK